MKRMMILALLCAVLGGCVVVPAGEGYGYDHDYHYNHGYYQGGYGFHDHGG